MNWTKIIISDHCLKQLFNIDNRSIVRVIAFYIAVLVRLLVENDYGHHHIKQFDVLWPTACGELTTFFVCKFLVHRFRTVVSRVSTTQTCTTVMKKQKMFNLNWVGQGTTYVHLISFCAPNHSATVTFIVREIE